MIKDKSLYKKNKFHIDFCNIDIIFYIIEEQNFLDFIQTQKINNILIKEYLNDTDTPDEMKSGAVINANNTLYILITAFKGEYLDIMNTIIHESTHATQEIFRIIGNDKVTEDLAESFAYLNSYIATKILKTIFKKDSKDKRFYIKI